MKVCLVVVAKLENRYIKEYVQYYKNIGIDTIFLGDNNDEDGEQFYEVINDEIADGFVRIINLRGMKMIQLSFYANIYKLYKT